jgi:hypothetical protein
MKKPKYIEDLGYFEKSDKKKQVDKKITSKFSYSNSLLKIFHSFKNNDNFNKFPLFARIEKNIKYDNYSSINELAIDIRNTFNDYFNLYANDPNAYTSTFLLSTHFEQLYKDYEIKNFQKETKYIIELKKKINKLRREVIENTASSSMNKMKINISDYNILKDKGFSKKFKINLYNNMKELDSDQMKGVLHIIHEFIKIESDKNFEFDIEKVPCYKIKELNKYVKKCLREKKSVSKTYTHEVNKEIPEMLTEKMGEKIENKKIISILSDSDSLSSDESDSSA